jgi:hypothetical protein
MTTIESYLAVDWPAEEAALAKHFASRDLTAPQIASLLEFCLAEIIGSLSRDPAEAERAMTMLCERSREVAAECCRSMRPASH